MLMSPIRLEQSLLVDSCEFFYGLGQADVLLKSQTPRCRSGGMHRIHSFEHDQTHICDLESAAIVHSKKHSAQDTVAHSNKSNSFSFNNVNFVNPIHESDKVRSTSTFP